MSHFTIIDSGTINSETNCPCQWILTNQWELIFRPLKEYTFIHSTNLTDLLDNDCWRNNIRSIIFNKGIYIWNSPDFSHIFQNYISLISADLQNLDFEDCSNLSYLFCNCTSLEKVLFPTVPFGKNVEYIDFMFYSCKHLQNVDLTNLNTSQLHSMDSAFSGCSKLTSINLSNIQFDTIYNVCMKNAFYNCICLQQCQLPFASSIYDIDLDFCFTNCISLKSIDLSTLSIEDDDSDIYIWFEMQNCFENCISLRYVTYPDIYHFALSDFHTNNIPHYIVQLFAPNIFINCVNLQTFKTKTIIPFELLKNLQIPKQAIISYFKQLDDKELSNYLECYTPYPSLKTELMNTLSLINFE